MLKREQGSLQQKISQVAFPDLIESIESLPNQVKQLNERIHSLESKVEVAKKPVEVFTQESQQISKEEEVDTPNLQAYRNEAYGFELKYPQEWPAPIFEEGDFYGGGAFPESINSIWRLYLGPINKEACEGVDCYDFYFDGFPINVSSDDIVNGLYHYDLISIKAENKVNDVRMIVYTEGGICGNKSTFLLGSNKIIRFTARCGADNLRLSRFFDQILETFQFIN